jgi:DNA-binding SARP family transcriptional activator
MEFRILGPTEVLVGTGCVHLPSGRGRALLALLILHVGEPVSADRLVDELWGEHPPPTAATVVQGHVSRLRAALEPGRAKGGPSTVLPTIGNGYCLAIDPDFVDANRFKRLLDQARGAAPDARSATLSAALGMWRGSALADFTYEPFAQRAITALEALRVEAIEERFEADLALGGGGELVTKLEQVIATYPFRERLHGFLMLALYRAARQADALAAYHRIRSLLVEEMGLEPGPMLRELEAAILRQDPMLEGRPGRRSGAGPTAAAASWLPRERRTVTVAAVDLTPYAGQSVDTEAVGHIGTRAANAAARVLERHGARVERSLGDLLIAFFGFPVAHEDDALRAVRAALEVRTEVHVLNDDPRGIDGVRTTCRAGIETGEIIVAGPGAALRDAITGTVVTAARRLQHSAGDGEVLAGPAAQRLLRGAAILKPAAEVAAREGPARAWRVLEVVSRAAAVPRVFGAAMFGRQEELTSVRSAFRRAVRSNSVVRVTVLGEAGIGKSRLARELLASVGPDAYTITQRCPAYDEAITFFPLREAVVESAGLRGWRALHDLLATDDSGPGAVAEIAAAIGLRPEPGSADRLFPATRRLFEAVARAHPLIVVLEDLHWAEPAFLDLVDYLSREATGPILLLCLARPDLIELRPAWQTTGLLYLEPLPPADVESMLIDRAGLIGPDMLRRIVEVSQGNPLFAEQLLAAIDDGTGDAVPGSLRGLLTTRLDRLGPGERDVLRSVSVLGGELDRATVTALLPEQAGPFIERHLDELEHKRLIERVRPGTFRFAHVLIRLAAYQSMTREDRARLHERVANWLERESPDPPRGLDEILRYHLHQADEHRRATGATP